MKTPSCKKFLLIVLMSFAAEFSCLVVLGLWFQVDVHAQFELEPGVKYVLNVPTGFDVWPLMPTSSDSKWCLINFQSTSDVEKFCLKGRPTYRQNAKATVEEATEETIKVLLGDGATGWVMRSLLEMTPEQREAYHAAQLARAKSLSEARPPGQAQRGRNSTGAPSAGSDPDKFGAIIQSFSDKFNATRLDRGARAALCERVVSDLRPLAQQGYSPAQWELATAYLDGTLSSRQASCTSLVSEAEGIVWLKRVADLGVLVARLRLAQLFANAESGTLDLVEAYALYDATNQAKERHCLSKLLSVEEIDHAQSLGAKYRHTPDPAMESFKSVPDPTPIDYCTDWYTDIVQPRAPIGTDAKQIEAELTAIASEAPSPLPDLAVTSTVYSLPNGTKYRRQEDSASLRFNNQTTFPMRVLLSGKISRSIRVSSGTSGTIRLFPGTYRIGIQLGTTAADMLRLYGEKVLDSLSYEFMMSQRPGPASNTPVVPHVQGGAAAIQEEIDAIGRSRQYSPLPTPQIGSAKNSAASTATCILQNRTAYTLRLLMSGPVVRQYELFPGDFATTVIPAGSYRIAVQATASPGLSFYGVQMLETGTVYTSEFYIK